MRQFVKNQILPILDSMFELHQVIIGIDSIEQKKVFIQDCQEAGRAIKEVIDENTTDATKTTLAYENYVQALGVCEEKESLDDVDLKVLNVYPDFLKNLIETTPTTYHVVFLPYKAAMWDSLESIWKAAQADKNCVAHVIAIPFFEYNSKNESWEARYEGDLFPADVPVTHYQQYSIEMMQPDIVYIHNPYDNRNRITSVHPDYYSEKLKQNVGRLIYVPYYVTSGFFPTEHLGLSAYDHVDNIVVQSEHVRSKFIATPYYEKVVVFGSPKLDHIINACRKKTSIPKAWEPMLKGRKAIMLNTSITSFLTDGEIYINKLLQLFKHVQKLNSLCLIWRPHPLLEGTVRSMRPELTHRYEELVNYFVSNNVGVYDTSPHLSRTIALSEGYIGEEGTSVINLFEVVGKPVFTLDSIISQDFVGIEQRRLLMLDATVNNDDLYFTAGAVSGLFHMDLNSKQINFIDRLKNQPKWVNTYIGMDQDAEQDTIYFAPYLATWPAKYSISTQQLSELPLRQGQESIGCKGVVKYKQSIFYIPMTHGNMFEYDLKDNTWKTHSACLEKVPKTQRNTINKVGGYAVDEQRLWITLENSHCIIEFDMDTRKYQYHALGEANYGYSAITCDGNDLWLAEVHSGYIVQWNHQTLKTQLYSMPKAFKLWTNNLNVPLTHLQLLNLKDYIVTVPGFAKYGVKVNKKTGATSILSPEFWEGADQIANGYHPKRVFSTMMAKQIADNTLLIQRRSDGKVAIIQLESDQIETFYPTLSEEVYMQVFKGEDGFEQSDAYHVFCRKESRYFTLQGFLDDIIHEQLEGVKERQLKAAQTMADNLDGTSGEKIYKYFIDNLV